MAMLQSESIKELTGALVKAQSVMKAAHFNKKNPHFKSSYADMNAVLDAVRKPLLDNGLAVTQTTEMRNGVFCLITRLAHQSGEWIAGEYPLPATGRPHEIGSAITYAKRYSLSAIAGISADEDDDGNAAQDAVTKPVQAVTPAKRPNPHVTQPRDINDFQFRTNADGEQIDYIPADLHRVEKLKVADARPVAETLLTAMRMCRAPEQLEQWAFDHAEQFAQLPDKWIDAYQGEYQALLDDLRKQKKAA
jgi:hypothetical protein